MIGKNIKHFRKLRQIKSYKLAQDMGVSASTLSLWESCKRDIGTKHIVKMCKALNITPNQLFLDIDWEISINDFNTICDLRPYLLRHPNREMVTASCLCFLGDHAQEWWNSRNLNNEGKK